MIQDIACGLPRVQTIVSMVVTGEFVFYQTGSRYMGCAREDSDWDFMVQDSPEVRAWLHGIGFSDDILAYAESYGVDPHRGSQTVAVLQCVDNDHKIQVQLARDVQLQRTVRDVITHYLPEKHREAGREGRQCIWNTLADVIKHDPIAEF